MSGHGLPLLLGLAFAASTASAATLTVNSTADNLMASDGQCTLREAIVVANWDLDIPNQDCQPGSGADTIVVRSQYWSALILLGFSRVPVARIRRG